MYRKVNCKAKSPAARMASAALIAALAMPLTALLPAAMPLAVTQAQAGLLQDHETTLAGYGSFYQHATYGKVWMPSAATVPQGWHPYPACNWVYTKYGWYFDDRTPWGAIVHHYGRWVHEANVGWMWVPGEDFSPGWVMWRIGEQWAGWAPMPPDQDMTAQKASAFDTDKHWTFIETAKLGSRCSSGAAVAATPQHFLQTSYVRNFTIVDGIVVFVFPAWLVGPILDIDIHFGPWAPIVIVNVIQNWIVVWNNAVINVACNVAPPQPNQIVNPINAAPPSPPLSAPPGRRTDLPPVKPLDPPTIRPIVDPVKPIYPGRPVQPIADPLRPIKPIDPGIGNGRPTGPIKPIDPIVDTRPGGKPAKPIDPGFGRPSGRPIVGNVKPIDVKPIDPHIGRPTLNVPGKVTIQKVSPAPLGPKREGAASTPDRATGGTAEKPAAILRGTTGRAM
ncbi:MAG: hypothetical protein HXY30_20855 [Pseudorhodoplanes sp.]|nr:hypothetical protein [Pseudorhodoplanes sp.]